jgi:hypothetical protein
LKLTNEGKDTVERLQLMTGLSKEQSRTFFESLLTLVVLNYLEGNTTYIPFIGHIDIDYLYDKFEGDTKKAVLDIAVNADDNLSRNIGQIEDGDESEIEEIYKRRIQGSLSKYIQGEDE